MEGREGGVDMVAGHDHYCYYYYYYYYYHDNYYFYYLILLNRMPLSQTIPLSGYATTIIMVDPLLLLLNPFLLHHHLPPPPLLLLPLPPLPSQLGEKYYLAKSIRRMQMRLRVYVRRELRDGVKDIEMAGENTGLAGVVANKGEMGGERRRRKREEV